MKTIIFLAAAALAGASFNSAAAEAGDSYGGVGLNLWDIGVSVSGLGSGSAEPKGLEGRYGYHFNPNFAVEGRFGIGMSDDDGVEVSRNFGVYLKGVIDASPSFQPYVMLGYTDLEIDVDGYSETDSDMSYGFGAMFGSGSTKFNVEWARLYSDSGDGVSLDIDAINVGLVFGF